MKNVFYLTTPLYYVNDKPHIGHAYTTIAADVLARWKRLSGQKVFFLTGTDEHGEKIEKAAADAGEAPADFVARVAQGYKDAWTDLSISYDDFIRTDEPRHTRVVQAVFEKLKASGDIYKGHYEGWYCMSDEAYFAESELVNRRCPNCGREVQLLKEESYFFRLSTYGDKLLAFFEAQPEFLSPRFRANEVINFVKSGLKDLSVSRTRVKWGIPVPSDPAHTVYVWFDALLNYISAAGYSADGAGSPDFAARWPADVHLIGKEILRFHAVIWPATLMALGLPLPKKVFAHGWWTVEGTKMSKSLGNVVDPRQMAKEYGADAFRYFVLREVPFGSDGDFSEKALLGRYNAELANNLGNLLQRTLTLLAKNFDGAIPPGPLESPLLHDGRALVAAVSDAFDRLAFNDALEQTYQLMVRSNKYIDEKAPWTLGPDRKDELAAILRECVRVLKTLAVLLAPFMPAKCAEIWSRLGETTPLDAGARDVLTDLSAGRPPALPPEQRTIKGDPLFARKPARAK